jgi:precorrin-6A synthase
MELFLVGIGTGNPEHLTLQAIRALKAADLIIVPRKAGKDDLSELRRDICAEVAPDVAIREFDLPVRDLAEPDYAKRVNDWHDAIAQVWMTAIDGAGRVALLVWGDPSLYDSTLRIAARLSPAPLMTVIPGITSIQALTAAHAIPLNDINEPVVITTGRQLRDAGWPPSARSVVVMLDGECSFQHLPPDEIEIWWAAFAGMPQQVILSGALGDIGPEIIETRARARAAHGWVMDIYLMRRSEKS